MVLRNGSQAELLRYYTTLKKRSFQYDGMVAAVAISI